MWPQKCRVFKRSWRVGRLSATISTLLFHRRPFKIFDLGISFTPKNYEYQYGAITFDLAVLSVDLQFSIAWLDAEYAEELKLYT